MMLVRNGKRIFDSQIGLGVRATTNRLDTDDSTARCLLPCSCLFTSVCGQHATCVIHVSCYMLHVVNMLCAHPLCGQHATWPCCVIAAHISTCMEQSAQLRSSAQRARSRTAGRSSACSSACPVNKCHPVLGALRGISRAISPSERPRLTMQASWGCSGDRPGEDHTRPSTGAAAPPPQ